MSSEASKYLPLFRSYLNGNVVDIASGGWPVVPWAIQIELPPDKFLWYNQRELPDSVEWKGDGAVLPFKDKTLDAVFSSHFLEDIFEWLPVLAEWTRCVKIGGYIVILLPDKKLWNEAIVLRSQPPNMEHRHESFAGELSAVFTKYFGHFQILEDRLTALTPEDYTILFVAKRIR